MTIKNPIVYVIDDDEAVRDSLCRLLSSEGLVAEAFGSGEEFISGVDSERAACLLIDVRMPGMNGFELIRNIGILGLSAPIILITGHGDKAMEIEARKAGASALVHKPFNDQELLDLVRAAMA